MKNKNIIKKIECFILVLLIFSISHLLAESCGDVNLSGRTDIVDALLIAQYYVGLDPPSFSDNEAADVNADGNITIIDALLVAQYYVGLISELPGCESGGPLILGFDIEGIVGSAEINSDNLSITATVIPVDLSSLVYNLSLTDGAELVQAPDLTDGEPVIFVVESAVGIRQEWNVTINVEYGISFNYEEEIPNSEEGSIRTVVLTSGYDDINYMMPVIGYNGFRLWESYASSPLTSLREYCNINFNGEDEEAEIIMNNFYYFLDENKDDISEIELTVSEDGALCNLLFKGADGEDFSGTFSVFVSGHIHGESTNQEITDGFFKFVRDDSFSYE